jgi:hypothetical protein
MRPQGRPVLYVYTQYQMITNTDFVRKPEGKGPLPENRAR